jgi:hypothetical protein
MTDYSAYINSLKNKKTLNNNVINTRSNRNSTNLYSRNNFESLFTDKSYYCTPVMITYDKQITYIEPPIDGNSEGENKNYILQSNNTIPNGTLKIIINNIDVSVKNSCVTLTTETSGGFTIFNKRYTKYTFVYLGEDFQLLWNSSLSAWTVLKYSGLFE